MNLTTPVISVKPIIRWAGSKRKILPHLAQFWRPSFKRYVEPFAGSAALFFRLAPPKALLGDVNTALIETYHVVRDRPDDLYGAVAGVPRTEATYYAMRDKAPDRLSPFERAVRFVYLNRNCFNGIYRTNAAGVFNVPYAHERPGALPSIENFRQCAQLLSHATLKAGDFGKVLSAVRAGDFVYLDPPYAVESRRIFTEYNRKEFARRDLERLAAHLCELDARGAHFVLSYADCTEARALFAGWNGYRIRVRRNVAGFTSARRLATEWLVTNIS